LLGDSAAVGAPYADDDSITPRGQAFVYARSGGKWQLQKSMTATVPRDVDYFGFAVLFVSPNTLFISASGDASASRGLNADPTQGLLVQSGAFYLFGRQGDDWIRTSFAKPDEPDRNSWMGQQVAISGGTMAVTGANENSEASGSGAVYIFR
jgi:hypothetical protein